MKHLSIVAAGICFSTSVVAQINSDLFNSRSFTGPIETVNCTLEDGTNTQCYQLKFYANDVNDDGPFCPSTTDDIGGLAIYKPGSPYTDLGLSVLQKDLFDQIEADGFDILYGANNKKIRINDPSDTSNPPSSGQSYCLQASADDDLELTFLIPVTPKNLSNANTIESVELFGVSLNGIPMNGEPPGVLNGPGGQSSDVKMPALDACGGHHDPAGYYHWHMIANSTNKVLDSLGITEVSCTHFTQDNSALMGYATDGYPIYGEREEDGSIPQGLDACNGHVGTTPDSDTPIYHYHAVRGQAPNTLPCLTGASAKGNFTYSYKLNTLSTKKIEQPNVFDMHPNPATSGYVIVETQGEVLQVVDNLGRQIPVELIEHADGYVLSTKNWKTGIYHIVVAQGKETLTQKLSIINSH